MPGTWTPELERRLLLSIITVLSPSPPKWDDVAKLMGLDYTSEALRQKYRTLRLSATDELSSPPDAQAVPKKSATPRKRTKEPKEMTPGKGDNGADAVNESTPSPSKKRKVKVEAKED